MERKENENFKSRRSKWRKFDPAQSRNRTGETNEGAPLPFPRFEPGQVRTRLFPNRGLSMGGREAGGALSPHWRLRHFVGGSHFMVNEMVNLFLIGHRKTS